MTTADLPTIRVTGPGDLVEAMPYLLGFHPAESLVVIGFDSAERSVRRVVVTARLDLTPDGVDRAALRSLVQVLGRSGARAAVTVLVSEALPPPEHRAPGDDPPGAGTTASLTELVGRELAEAGMALLDALAASATRWWSLRCAAPGCCPPHGTPRPAATSAVAAQATYAGMVALPDRETVRRGIDGAPAAIRAALLPALRRADERFAELIERNGEVRARRGERGALVTAARECEAGTLLSPRRLARLGAALRDLEVRDALWLLVDDRTLAAERLLTQLHARLPSPYQAAPLFLFGWHHWRTGNGTLAGMVAEQALQADPEYSAAHLLLDALEAGMDPRTTPLLASGRASDVPA
ncbi:MAG TPA: DUF4192 domain-containing protein [Jatrophihabitans sp.]|nr:DUF4192 domain-containing protein [Jatrophihabitans sp.]